MPPLHPVKGKVTVGKKAYTGGGNVTFHPTDAKILPHGVQAPAGSIDAGGNYELKTSGKSGAPEGTYKVTVSMQTMPVEGKKKMEFPFNQDYNFANKTPLQRVVPVDNPGAYDFALKK